MADKPTTEELRAHAKAFPYTCFFCKLEDKDGVKSGICLSCLVEQYPPGNAGFRRG